MKSDIFNIEIKYIKDKHYQEVARKLLEMLPDYFYSVPAASTGKYHPEFAQGEKGLVRHTKVVVKIAKDLLDNPMINEKYTSEERDIMLVGMLVHDGVKSGYEKSTYTVVDHPILMANLIRDHATELALNESALGLLTSVIETHMGPWNTDYNGNEILRKPNTKYERFVHMCDYLASRKFLNVKFVNDEIVE